MEKKKYIGMDSILDKKSIKEFKDDLSNNIPDSNLNIELSHSNVYKKSDLLDNIKKKNDEFNNEKNNNKDSKLGDSKLENFPKKTLSIKPKLTISETI